MAQKLIRTKLRGYHYDNNYVKEDSSIIIVVIFRARVYCKIRYNLVIYISYFTIYTHYISNYVNLPSLVVTMYLAVNFVIT